MFLSFPTRRKRSAARFDTFRRVGNVQRRVLELSEASETFSGAFLSFPRPRKRSAARFDTFRGVGDASQVCRVPEGPPAGRVGAYCIRPTKRPGTGRMIISGVHPFGPVGASGTPAKFGRVRAFVTVIRALRPGWGAYSIRPYTVTCICPDGALRCWGLRPCWFVEAGTQPNV